MVVYFHHLQRQSVVHLIKQQFYNTVTAIAKIKLNTDFLF